MNMIREVWRDNLEQEFDRICNLAVSPCCHCIGIDTEFPGFLHNTPFGASEEQRYGDVKRNVDMMKIIQFGLTFFNLRGLPRNFTWQINLREFNPTTDPHAEVSIRLLKDSGINFNQNQRDGVDSKVLSRLLHKLVFHCRYKTKWITFHGLYDVAYIMKLLTGRPLPNTLPEFLHLTRGLIGNIYDVKCMARCFGYDERIGLVKLAGKLGMVADGKHHQAGYDSLLIVEVFWKLKEKFSLHEDNFVGVIYGAETTSIELIRRSCGRRVVGAPSY